MEPGYGSARNWEASLSLRFSESRGRSVLSRLRFRGPLRVQRVFYPEDGPAAAYALPAHCYVLHPPGGMVSGDDLAISVAAEEGAHAVVTTPAPGKIYRADSCGVPQRQDVRLDLRGGAVEWLPRAMIVFSGARARLSLNVDLRGDSRFIGWETVVLGRAAGARPFVDGEVRQSVRLTRDGTPALSDRLVVAAGDGLAAGGFGLAGMGVVMNLWAVGTAADGPALRAAAGEAQAALAAVAPGRSGATCRDGVLVARYLGGDGREAEELGRLAWRIVRPRLLGRADHAPRIWKT